MNEQTNPDPSQEDFTPEENIAGEFRTMANNLANILRAAWERPERQKLQQEIENGLNEVGSALRKEAKNITSSPVSQKIKTEVEDVSERVRSGQVETKVRVELINALHMINTELEKVSTILSSGPSTAEESQPAKGESVEDEIGQEAPSESEMFADSPDIGASKSEQSTQAGEEEQ